MNTAPNTTIEIRRRVMIACVTTEVIKVVKPAEDLNIERIHLINYVVKANPNDEGRKIRENLYEEAFQRTVELLRKNDIDNTTS